MEFGIQFFPDVGPGEKSAAKYWADALHLVSLCDPLGYTSVRTVEHYFHRYGGYSPNPIVFFRRRHAYRKGPAIDRRGLTRLAAIILPVELHVGKSPTAAAGI